MSDLIHVKGLSEVQKFMTELPTKLQKNVLRGGMRAGVTVLKQAAMANVPSGPPSNESMRLYGAYAGALRDSMRVSVRIRGKWVVAKLKAGGIVTKGGADLRVLNVAIWAEYGTRPHTITAVNRKGLSFGGHFFQSVQHPGARPHPYMRPALDSTAGAAVVAVGNYIKKRLATKQGLDTADIVIEEG